MYYKIINDRTVFSACKTIELDGVWISNPSEEQIAEAGWLPYVPPVVPPQPEIEPDYGDILAAVKKMLSTETEELSDEEALEVAALYPTWASKIDSQVEVGERLWYDGKLYKVLQPHTPQSDWTPDITPALYAEVSIEEWPDWRQPLGSEDAYKFGDKVSHDGKHWVSNMNANVFEPGVYGWDEA